MVQNIDTQEQKICGGVEFTMNMILQTLVICFSCSLDSQYPLTLLHGMENSRTRQLYLIWKRKQWKNGERWYWPLLSVSTCHWLAYHGAIFTTFAWVVVIVLFDWIHHQDWGKLRIWPKFTSTRRIYVIPYMNPKGIWFKPGMHFIWWLNWLFLLNGINSERKSN